MARRLCLKVPYETPREAKAALRRIRARKRRDHRPQFERKPYCCDLCGKYHLTKMRTKNDKSIDHHRGDDDE